MYIDIECFVLLNQNEIVGISFLPSPLLSSDNFCRSLQNDFKKGNLRIVFSNNKITLISKNHQVSFSTDKRTSRGLKNIFSENITLKKTSLIHSGFELRVKRGEKKKRLSRLPFI